MHGRKRLIILANHRQARLVRANGLKVQETVLCLSNASENHVDPLSRPRIGHDKGMADSHFFPPHTQFKEIEKEQFAHEIAKEVLHVHLSYDEIILACEPKMLGLLKKELSHYKAINIYKTFSLDAVGIEDSQLEAKILEATSD